jgi:co-chaperonin GroES (HSP10)
MSLDNFRLFHVLPGNLLVIPDPDQTSKGSIYFPDNMHAKAQTGIVVQHGELYLDNLEGQRILFEKWTWRELKMKGIEFYIVTEASVWATVSESVHQGE